MSSGNGKLTRRHTVIFLQPECDGDDCPQGAQCYSEGRLWCEDEGAVDCEQCGRPAEKYVRFDLVAAVRVGLDKAARDD